MRTYRQRKQAHQAVIRAWLAARQAARCAAIHDRKVTLPDGRVELIPKLGTFTIEDLEFLFPIEDGDKPTEEFLKTKMGYCAAKANAERIGKDIDELLLTVEQNKELSIEEIIKKWMDKRRCD